MDEEINMSVERKKQQQEQVKKQQLAIASSMKISQVILTLLETIEEWHIREWLYICAIDGMTVEQIQTLSQSPTIGKIKKARLDFWRDLCVGTDILQKNMEKLQTEVLEVCEESRQARAAIENGLEDALKREAAAQAETIRTKDELNCALREQLRNLEEQLQQLKTQSSETECGETTQGETIQLEREEMLSSEVKNNVPMAKKKSDSGRFFLQFLKGADTKKFIERYIKDKKMSAEQTEFLLECLEEGVSVKEIESFASPELSVDVMRRLKKLKEKVD